MTNVGSDAYKSDYSQELAKEWDKLIGWDNRAKAEGNFLPSLLSELNVKTVWDVATGSGFHASMLHQSGFTVRASDGAEHMVDSAQSNFSDKEQDIECFVADWRQLDQHRETKYDALICLGNSFSHLFSQEDRLSSLTQMRQALNPSGYLIIDNRNYDALLEGHVRDPDESNCCCSDRSSVRLTLEKEDLVYIRCSLDGREITQINTYPLTQDHFQSLLGQAGFELVFTYGDFRLDRIDTEVEFYLYVLRLSSSSDTH